MRVICSLQLSMKTDVGSVITRAEMGALHLESDFFKTSLGKPETCVNFHI